MRRAGLAALVGLAALGAPPAQARAPRLEVMIAGRSSVLRPAVEVAAPRTTVKVGRRRCAVGEGTALAALAALRTPTFHVRDFGACSDRARDAESLFVDRIGPERNRGVDGWVYKLGRLTPGIGAGAPAARARSGTRILWFWCRKGPRGCQRSLEITARPARAAPGENVTFTVRGYDDRERGVAIAGAIVRFAGAQLTTAADGKVATTAPSRPGRFPASAEARGLVPSFPVKVVVG